MEDSFQGKNSLIFETLVNFQNDLVLLDYCYNQNQFVGSTLKRSSMGDLLYYLGHNL